ncbi:ribonuclease P protein component [Empedobacter falsenii]|jgi:ribonuclease P protein component|uniref:ribonuclease P protein component n=1 Tax=Empedobacter TaxID=59734 RepID=UPI002448C446|nr:MULTISPECIES: ribonuclease P protein component [Empedobacter]MDH1883285.1 ribonuclease P protein component [Empedobacter sp. GD03797]MDM1042961.1 ribonuclease P protein component [Empedobacter brevis]MDM1136891.1 ribonuclease P protein component [Empedobacter sp. R750]
MKLTFGKNEKLKSRKAFDELFSDGKTFVSHPIRFVYKIKPKADYNIRVGVSVGKKKFKHAVDRNLLKRRAKEAYRLNKLLLEPNENYSIDLVMIYTSTKHQPFEVIEQSVKTLLEKLNEAIQTKKD